MGEEERDIPKGWKREPFVELIFEHAKSGLKVSDAANFGNIPFFTSGENVLMHNEALLDDQNIFLATGGVANVKFYKGQASYSTDTFTISTTEKVEALYLFYFLLDKIEYINTNYFQGSGLKHLQKKELRKHLVGFPKSLPEQQKIAEILGKVDEALAHTQALLAKYQRIKAGLMQDLLTKGIDENGNIRTEATHRFKDSPLGRVPEEWEVNNLGLIASVVSGITLGKDYVGFDTVERPYLRVANVQDGFFDLSEIKYIRVPVSFLEKYRLEKGDVMMNEGGDFDKLGRGSVWNNEIKDCLFQNHVYRVRTDRSKILPEYLATYSTSSFGKSFFILSSKQSTNLASISKTQLVRFPIKIPSLKEQQRIQDFFGAFSQTEETYGKELSKLQRLKTGLMQDLLTGKVRVNALLPKEALANG